MPVLMQQSATDRSMRFQQQFRHIPPEYCGQPAEQDRLMMQQFKIQTIPPVRTIWMMAL